MPLNSKAPAANPLPITPMKIVDNAAMMSIKDAMDAARYEPPFRLGGTSDQPRCRMDARPGPTR